ncbi:MAG: MarR family transcriptional regulator [Cellulomonas sp.]|nr:MarR family transcriptional regulator [Cellulomonas sp.]
MPRVNEFDVVAVANAVRHLILAGDQFRSAFASQLRINVTELTALGYLIESGEPTPKRLAQLLGITTGSVTGMVDHLEAIGLIIRVPNPVDRRSILVHPTLAAVAAMRGVYDQYHAALARALESGAQIPPPELALLLEHTGAILAEAAVPSPRSPGRRPRG